MFSIGNIKEYLYDYRHYKKAVFKDDDDLFNLYMSLILTIVLIPVVLSVDILFFPFEIGYLLFKRIVGE